VAKARDQVWVRLDMKLPRELKDFAQEYAKKKGTTLSQLIRDFLVGLKNVNPRQF